MKRNEHFNEAANAGGGTTQVPFYGVVAPSSYIGEAFAAALLVVSGAISRGVDRMRRRHWERKTRDALAELDDAILHDIGVTRTAIPEIARTAAENATFDGARRFPWAA